MKKRLMILTLVAAILSISIITGCGDDKKDTNGPSISVEDNISGSWITTSIMVMNATDIQESMNVVMEADFAENLDLTVTLTQGDSAMVFTGTYSVDKTTVVMNLNGPEGSITLTGTMEMESTTTASYETSLPGNLVVLMVPAMAGLGLESIPTTFELTKQN